MMKNKKVHLARFIALYLTGCIFTGEAVCYAYNNIYGNGNDEVIISDGETYDFVYGSQDNSTVDSTSISISGGTITRVYGSGNGTNSKADSTSISISGGTINSYVYGSGEDSTTGSTSTSITDGKINGYVYGSGLDSKADSTSISISGGTINGYVLGSGNGTNSKADSTSISISGGTINSVYGSGTDSTTGSTSISISGGTIDYDVYGSGEDSTVDSTSISISSGTINKSVYGSGNGTNSKADSTSVSISGGTIHQSVYGSGTDSTVENATIHISNGTIDGSVYGSEPLSTVKNAIIGISGGSIAGNIEAGNVSGQKLLYFTGGSPTVGGSISGFDSVIITDGTVTLKGSFLSASDVSINENGLLAIAKDMKFTLDSTNGSLNIAGELFIPSAITLTIEDGTVSTQPTGMITLGVDNNHSNPGKIVLKNNANFATGSTLNLNINLPLDELLKMSGDEIQAILSQALGSAVSSVDIGNGSNAEYSYIKDANGKIIGVRPNSSAFDTYLGVRQANAHIAHSVMDSVHERNAALRTGAHSDDFWVNMHGGKSDINSKYGTASLKSQYYQLGYDWDLSDSDSARAVGVYVSKINGSVTQQTARSDIDSGYDFGVYGLREYTDGSYLSLVGRYGQMKNIMSVDSRRSQWKDKGYALSAEVGKRLETDKSWQLEPYMQLTYQGIEDTGLNTGFTDIRLDKSDLLDGKLGIRFIKEDKERENDTIFAGLSYRKGLHGSYKAGLSSMGLTKMDNDGDAVELMLGMNHQLSEYCIANVHAKKEFGDYDGWSVQGTIEVSF